MDTFLLHERDMYLNSCLAARRVPANLWRKAGVRAGGGPPGSSEREGRSLDFDQPCGCRAYRGGETRRVACRREVAAREAAQSSDGGPHDRPQPEKNRYRGVSVEYFRTRHLLKNGDSIHVFDQPLPQSAPAYQHAASSSVERVIATLLVKAAPSQLKPPGEGRGGLSAIKHVLENSRRRTGDMRKSGAAAATPARHRLKLRTSFPS
jgi:hypothetical protein